MARLEILENTSEIGAGTRGSGLGPEALRYAAIKQNSDFFVRYPVHKITTYNEVLKSPSTLVNAWYLDKISMVYKNVCSEVSRSLGEGSFPIILAGDHSSAGASIAGIKEQHPTKRLGVIWIDAHADLHSPYTTPSGNVHGMPLATAIAEDNVPNAINEPNNVTIDHWEKLKATGGVIPKIQPSDIVFFGVRDTEPPEEALMGKYVIPNFTVDKCRDRGIAACVKDGIRHLRDCDLIYISFDVDSMDCDSVSNGTGTPVPHGFTAQEAYEILASILEQSDKICAFEMVEINPLLDHGGNSMAEVSFGILEQLTQYLEKYTSPIGVD